jgi:hypothetical protein
VADFCFGGEMRFLLTGALVAGNLAGCSSGRRNVLGRRRIRFKGLRSDFGHLPPPACRA